ncbi:MAG: L-rhamnose mutarotase [Syntrophaceae bacterium]|nr:L-rhamnose mutarotase [Syntrophaceae bacterium]
MKRFGQVIGVRPEKLDDYKTLHQHPWPGVLQKIRECNIRNYSIFLLDDHTLFAYFEYTGDDFEADMAQMAADPVTQAWWKETAPCQESMSADGSAWWKTLPEIFHAE